MSSRTLVVGLGNPGSQYQHSPHNLGFEVIDDLAVSLQARWATRECEALVASTERDGAEWVLVKPQTSMNRSGRAVESVMEQYRFGLSELLVVCDDLALPFGRIRIRAKGGAGGHNGLRSIIESVGSNEFARLRLGILPEIPITDAAEYVLNPISKEFGELTSTMVKQACRAILTIVRQGLLPAMNTFNGVSAPGKTDQA